ncbi:MAG: GNAT family N-acetyltransferase [Polynucleobacter sp.]|nr:GNAT family N-acetyltransferase [Polynucleobacter sp.]
MPLNDSVELRVLNSIHAVSAQQWDRLLPSNSTPFLRHAFLSALEDCGCVGKQTGWQIAHLAVFNRGANEPIGLMPLYLKTHSYGEYVFDWSLAEAYSQNGMAYYPKALCSIPFTPVQGSRILLDPAHNPDHTRQWLIQGLKQLLIQNKLSSAHILFPDPETQKALLAQDFMVRDSVQFHWKNAGYTHMDAFLSQLNMKRRKNIRRERSQVADAGVTFLHQPGRQANPSDWSFFYRCYANTYIEHHSSPYLNEDFFQLWAERMPDYLHLILAQKNGRSIAASLLVVDRSAPISTAYGRYWGSTEYVPCLHFETAYYQAIEYCIREGIQVLEGGAQGQHKMARGFLPVTVQSAHWIQDAQFSEAVARFLERERDGISAYVDELAEHSPLKSTTVLE